jgi:hypothetical protein
MKYLDFAIKVLIIFGLGFLFAAFYEGNFDFATWQTATKTSVITWTVVLVILF